MRVIAGELRGRRLSAPRGRGTRPTSDRVREALFGALGAVDGAFVLDLYAGSGALAIEALSRGARAAAAVERDPAALRALRANLRELGLLDRCRVCAMSVARFATTIASDGRLRRELALDEARFDLVLADPPYAAVKDAANAIDRIVRSRACDDGATLVIEHGRRDEPPVLHCATCERTRLYGDTALSFYRVHAPAD